MFWTLGGSAIENPFTIEVADAEAEKLLGLIEVTETIDEYLC